MKETTESPEIKLLLNDQEKSYVQGMRHFFDTHISPVALEIEEAHAYPPELYQLLREKKYLGYVFPPELGGEGLSYLNYSNLMRESTLADANTSIFVTCFNSLIGDPVTSHTWDRLRPEEKKEFLSGELLPRLEIEVGELCLESETLLQEKAPQFEKEILALFKANAKEKILRGLSGAPLMEKAAALFEFHKKSLSKGSPVLVDPLQEKNFEVFFKYRTRLDQLKMVIQVELYLKTMLTGERVGTFGLTEPNAGSDATNTQTTATIHSGNCFYSPHTIWNLNGSKTWITLGSSGNLGDKPGFHLIISQTEFGPTAFLLDQFTPGFEIVEIKKKLFMGSTGTSQLMFTEVKLPGSQILGRVGEGFHVAFKALDKGRIGIGSQAYGLAYGAFNSAFNYAGQREQFNSPIKFLPQLSHLLSEMKLGVDGIALLIRHACHLCDGHIPFSVESAMCKLYASEAGQRITENAIQVKGGYGYSIEEPVGRYYLVSKLTQIYEGTSQVQRQIIANYNFSCLINPGQKSPGDLDLTQKMERLKKSESAGKNQLFKGLLENLDFLDEMRERIGHSILLQDADHFKQTFENGVGKNLKGIKIPSTQNFTLYNDWEKKVKSALGEITDPALLKSLPGLPSDTRSGLRFHQRFFEGFFADCFCQFNISRLSLIRVAQFYYSPAFSADYWTYLLQAAGLHLSKFRKDLIDLAARVSGEGPELATLLQLDKQPPMTVGFANFYPRFMNDFLYNYELPE